ncbi:hypothetical protein FRD01_18300 [Microvenator marinus]|jgi:hypothetical protein|uniref:Uncharacterized protein n=1 Tax=Microvenator marinus TaxID=2600177 RepID=A0A5B8XVF0_9DELT|nr:hypothetical protein [Microvenator marinus]QED29157.1 hypothetical protein FRD01_18300 [Microvenator marinus]
MRERPLPEAIRGSWYYLPANTDPRQTGEKGIQMYRFRLDGTFSLFGGRAGSWTEKERGEYTFDGQFLIIRGRNTETFRVKASRYWRWTLEGKKEDYVLVRGKATDDDFKALPPEQAKEIRILPIRVLIHNEYDEREGIFELVYESENIRKPVGSFFVEHNTEDGKMWVGLSPWAEGLEPKTWERIIRESFLDIHRSKPDDVTVVTIRNLRDNESKVFNYVLG